VQSLKIVLTIAVALFLQLLLAKYLSFFKYVDLPLIVTVYFGLQRSPLQGMLGGLAAGLGGDAIYGGILGVGGFSKTLIGYIIAMASVRLSLENALVRVLVVALASIFNTILFIGLYQMLQQSQTPEQALPHTGSLEDVLRTVGLKTLADVLASIVAFILLDRVFHEQATAKRMAIKRRFYE
jgi:rod shape-determining protein MreD